MTKLKTISAIAVISAAIAGPASAQDAGVIAPAYHGHYGRAYDQRNFRGAYDQLNGPFYAAPQTDDERNIENFGFSGRDPSRVGGESPWLNPSGS
jgi:hypothetical protein